MNGISTASTDNLMYLNSSVTLNTPTSTISDADVIGDDVWAFSEELRYWLLGLHVAVTGLGAVGSVGTLVVFLSDKTLWKTSYILIDFLQAVDLMHLLVIGSVKIKHLLSGQWLDEKGCAVMGFLSLQLMQASSLTCVVIAINRYVRVFHSSAVYDRLFSLRRSILWSGFICLIAFATLSYAPTRYYRTLPGCMINCQQDAVHAVSLFVIYLASWAAVVVIYSKMMNKVTRLGRVVGRSRKMSFFGTGTSSNPGGNSTVISRPISFVMTARARRLSHTASERRRKMSVMDKTSVIPPIAESRMEKSDNKTPTPSPTSSQPRFDTSGDVTTDVPADGVVPLDNDASKPRKGSPLSPPGSGLGRLRDLAPCGSEEEKAPLLFQGKFPDSLRSDGKLPGSSAAITMNGRSGEDTAKRSEKSVPFRLEDKFSDNSALTVPGRPGEETTESSEVSVPLRLYGKFPGGSSLTVHGSPVEDTTKSSEVRVPLRSYGKFPGDSALNVPGRSVEETTKGSLISVPLRSYGKFRGNSALTSLGHSGKETTKSSEITVSLKSEGRFFEKSKGNISVPGSLGEAFRQSNDELFLSEGNVPLRSEVTFPGKVEQRFPGVLRGKFPERLDEKFPRSSMATFPRMSEEGSLVSRDRLVGRKSTLTDVPHSRKLSWQDKPSLIVGPFDRLSLRDTGPETAAATVALAQTPARTPSAADELEFPVECAGRDGVRAGQEVGRPDDLTVAHGGDGETVGKGSKSASSLSVRVWTRLNATIGFASHYIPDPRQLCLTIGDWVRRRLGWGEGATPPCCPRRRRQESSSHHADNSVDVTRVQTSGSLQSSQTDHRSQRFRTRVSSLQHFLNRSTQQQEGGEAGGSGGSGVGVLSGPRRSRGMAVNFVLCMLNMGCCLPFYLLFLLNDAFAWGLPASVQAFSHLVVLLGSALNCLVYGVMNTSFHLAGQKLLQRARRKPRTVSQFPLPSAAPSYSSHMTRGQRPLPSDRRPSTVNDVRKGRT